MKKLILTNMIVGITFLLFEPLLNYLDKWSDKYSLGAEMVLGILSPILFAVFAALVLGLTVFSVIKAIAKKDIKKAFPLRERCQR